MSDPARHLAATRFLAMWWSQGDQSQEPAEFVRMFDGYLDAFVALDAIPTEEDELWRDRMRVRAADDGRPLSSLFPAVEAELERAFAELPETIDVMEHAALSFNALIGAAHQIGALPADGFREWAVRIGARLAPPSESPPPRDPYEERRMQALTDAPHRGELLRVLRGPDVRRAGLRVRSVELYENGVTVCWHFVSKDEDWPRQQDQLSRCVELSDDQGTEYYGRGGGASRLGTAADRETVVEGQDEFVPAPPPDARTLTVTYNAEDLAIDVAGT